MRENIVLALEVALIAMLAVGVGLVVAEFSAPMAGIGCALVVAAVGGLALAVAAQRPAGSVLPGDGRGVT